MVSIYEIKNKYNGKRYIGQSVNVRKRWNSEKCELRKGVFGGLSDHPLARAWNKYNETYFEWSVICIVPVEEANNVEILEIAFWKSLNLSYNISNGGDGPGKFSEETKKKMSEAKLGVAPWNKGKKKVYSEKRINQLSEHSKRNWEDSDFRKNQTDKHLGQIAWNKGKKLSPEHVNKMLESRKKYHEARKSAAKLDRNI